MLIDVNILKKAVFEAGIILEKAYAGDYETSLKPDESPVTSADIASQREIIQILSEAYPLIPIVAEEEGRPIDPTWTTYFLIDPLDGTKEFLAKTDEFAVLIAFIKEGELHQSMIYAPVLKRLFYAVRGIGAFEWRVDQWIALKVSENHENGTALTSRFHKNKPFMEALENQAGIVSIKEYGSALKGCLIAAGQAELYLRWGNTYKWDTGAMQLLVEEAGGVVTDLEGIRINYDLHDLLNAKGLVISNGHFTLEKLGEACRGGINYESNQ